MPSPNTSNCILEKLEQSESGIRLDAFERVFAQECAHEHRRVDVRLSQKVGAGTIEIRNCGVILTERGSLMSRPSRTLRVELLPRQRLLLGQYSDVLVDPSEYVKHLAEHICGP